MTDRSFGSRGWVVSYLLVMSAVAALMLGPWFTQAGRPEESQLGMLNPGSTRLLPYSSAGVWGTRIPEDAPVDPNSARMVQGLVRDSEANGALNLAHRDWTISVYVTAPDTPRHDVLVKGRPPGAHYDPGFTHDTRSTFAGVPIPEAARPDRQADAHLSVIDLDAACEYDLYGARKVDGRWEAEWANAIPLSAGGVYPNGLSSRATGFSGLAGLIWPEELRRGRIDHALLFAYPLTRAGGPVLPATASDGKTEGDFTIPQGARLQLDPELDLSTLGLTPVEYTIARALQDYGMFLGDTGGRSAVYAVGENSFTSDPYRGLLPAGGSLGNIPLDRLRVLELGEQQKVTPLRVQPNSCNSGVDQSAQ